MIPVYLLTLFLVCVYAQQTAIETTKPADNCDRKSELGDVLTWKYKGTFQDGKVFDEGQFTAELGQKQVIPGVEQGMLGMCVGEVRKLTVPPELAYGDKGVPPNPQKQGDEGIQPGTTLIFENELLHLQPGLNVEVIGEAPACGKKSNLGDTITWSYKGTFTDGKVFDEGTFEAVLGRHQIIPGVEEGMMGMCVGESRRITVPPHLGYGPQGFPGLIPPHSTLIFENTLTAMRDRDEL